MSHSLYRGAGASRGSICCDAIQKQVNALDLCCCSKAEQGASKHPLPELQWAQIDEIAADGAFISLQAEADSKNCVTVIKSIPLARNTSYKADHLLNESPNSLTKACGLTNWAACPGSPCSDTQAQHDLCHENWDGHLRRMLRGQ